MTRATRAGTLGAQGYAVLVAFGHLRDFLGKLTGSSRYFGANSRPPKGYAPLLQDWENFYTRRLYHRIQDCWNRPYQGPPAAQCTEVLERDSKDGNFTLQQTGKVLPCVNLGSYNYLGFADDWQETCREDVVASLNEYSPSVCSSRFEAGTTKLHVELEALVARFVGKEAAICFNMGYGTNASSIPSLAGPGCLIISDALNHTSIVNGARASGAKVKVFKHNDEQHLGSLLRTSIAEGQPGTHKPWRKILVMVEGIYSMEGEVCPLPKILAVVKQYGAYLYLDEAHSIGALGPTGRGACDHWGVDPNDVDVLMGTFTKSFGAMGGYVAASAEFIAAVRRDAGSSVYGNAMSPVVVAQTIRAFKVIMGEDGTRTGQEKILALRRNCNYFREKLVEMGCQVLGDEDSPVCCVLLYNPTKIAAFSRECLDRGLAVVVVGFPATPLITSRARFCVSAGHTIADLDKALEKVSEVCDVLKLRYKTNMLG